MKTKEFLEKKLKDCERKEQFRRTMGIRRFSGNFLEKARHNLVTTKALWILSENEKIKEEYISLIKRAKRTREAAQYSVEKTFSRKEAEHMIGMATEFVNRIDEMLSA